MIFKTCNKKITSDIPDIQISGQIIKREKETKFLGIIIDEKLDWSYHISKTRNKIAKGVGIIRKARKFLNESTLVTLYYSFVYPYLLYGIIAWGNTHQSHLDGLIKIQKRAVRVITFSSWDAHTAPLFNKLKLLNFSKIYQINVLIFMFKLHYGMLPPVFNEMFALNNTVHSHYTRQAQLYHFPKWKLEVVRRSIRIQGVYVWNSISVQIKHDCSLACFKHHAKYYFMNM